MAVRNPCEEQEPQPPRPRRRDRFRRRDREVQDTTTQPEIIPIPPEDPFALAVPLPELPQREGDVPIQAVESEIQYVSATRDLSTIDESNFYQLVSPQVMSTTAINGSSIWLSQKTSQEVAAQADRFRLALLNFWSFDGDSEVISSRPVGDPRTDRIALPFIGASNSPLSAYVPLLFKPYESQSGQGQYFKLDFHDSPEYSLVENLPFAFERNLVILAMAKLPNVTKASHFMDFYLKGEESTVWRASGRGTFWPFNPAKRSFYSGGNLEFGKQFQDYTFDAPAAFFESEMDNILVSPFDSADISVRAENHEIHSDKETELQIPNIYQYYNAQQVTRLINDDLLLVENLPPYEVEYNQMLISNYEELENDIDFETSSVMKFPSNKVEMLEEINESLRGSLTNFVEIGINTTQGGPINAMLQRNRMDTIVLEFLTNEATFNPSREIEKKLFTKVLDDQFISADGEENVNRTVNDKAIQNIEEDVFRDFDKQTAAVSNNAGRNTAGYFWPRELMEYPLYYTGWENQNLTKLEEAIRSQIFTGQMNQHIKDAKLERTFADVLYGRKAYSEVVGYKVEKHRINQEAGGTETEEKVQEFLLMDNDSISRINLLDTQILPGKKYVYKVFTINLVIGTKYEYNEAMSSFTWMGQDPNDPASETQVLDVQNYNASKSRFSIGVTSGRVISLIYAPFFEKTISMSDKPPLSPQVSFLPYQGVDNRHSVLLEVNHGETREHPIVIYREDKSLIENSYRTQNVRPGSKILYKSDSLPTEFEMIRIENAPESYKDFSQDGAIRRRVSANGKTGFLTVSLEPNKCYYYTFRTYDEGGVSNPSEVYRVRMVSYQNGIFMEMEPYEMYIKQKEYRLSFERLLKIRPAFDQRVINFEKVFEEIEAETQEKETSLNQLRTELGLKGPADTRKFQKSAPTKEKISIGNTDPSEAVWDKNFKIRIKSKTTGKKIDLNVTFSNKKTTITAEE